MLEKARAARFSQIEMNRGLPAALLAKYFRRDGMQWELAPHVRSMASFCKLNLIERWPTMPQMDVVFLRNVLIYFSPETKKTILEKVRHGHGAARRALSGRARKRRWAWTPHLRESKSITVFFTDSNNSRT